MTAKGADQFLVDWLDTWKKIGESKSRARSSRSWYDYVVAVGKPNKGICIVKRSESTLV